ncbi:MAG: hypothetical protein IT313_12655 [Anaerolineales bacterium]|nr:hypothetical protein [Anaerolineales bacterium]
MNQNQILKRYYKEFVTGMTAYVVALIVSLLVLNNTELPQMTKIVIVLIPIVPVVFVLLAILRALRDSDELVQRIQLQAVTFSSIATGLVTFSYGFLEGIGFPKLPTLWILPMMFLFWGISLSYFNRKYQ